MTYSKKNKTKLQKPKCKPQKKNNNNYYHYYYKTHNRKQKLLKNVIKFIKMKKHIQIKN